MTKLRIAITGASGFCGAAVARAAHAAGAEVLCVGRRPGPVGRHIPWDATGEPPNLENADVVVHLAAAVGDPQNDEEMRFRAVNIDGTRRLLESVSAHDTARAGNTARASAAKPDGPYGDNTRVVYVSSASVYRPGPYGKPVDEDHPKDRQKTAYGRTKREAEKLALAAGAVVLRPRAVYGAGDPHLVPRLRRTVRAGRAWLPGPDVPLSLTAVENLAAACLQAPGWPPGAYNIADADAYSRDDVIARVLNVKVGHLPIKAARALAAMRPKTISPYAIDQVTDGLVLDIGKALAQGYRPINPW